MERILLRCFRALIVVAILAGIVGIPSNAALASVNYGESYHVENLFGSGTYLDSSNIPAPENCDGGYNVSAASKDGEESQTSIWTIYSPSGKTGSVECNDLVYLQNKGNATYLETCNTDCEDNVFCVSTSKTPTRFQNSGTWKVICPGGTSLSTNQQIFLANQFLFDTYLDVRGAGCDDNVYCVSTAYTPTRDGKSGTWSFSKIKTTKPTAGCNNGKNSKHSPKQIVQLKNKETHRLAFSAGDPTVGEPGDEGGWLKSPEIVGSDANYYGRAKWYLTKSGDAYLLENTKTHRLIFSTGEPTVGKPGDEGGWLKSPEIVGSDANYYERAKWYLTKSGDTYLLENKETHRLLFSTGEPTVGKPGDEGGWLKSPPLVGSDANYYERAKWYISGPGTSILD